MGLDMCLSTTISVSDLSLITQTFGFLGLAAFVVCLKDQWYKPVVLPTSMPDKRLKRPIKNRTPLWVMGCDARKLRIKVSRHPALMINRKYSGTRKIRLALSIK